MRRRPREPTHRKRRRTLLLATAALLAAAAVLSSPWWLVRGPHTVAPRAPGSTLRLLSWNVGSPLPRPWMRLRDTAIEDVARLLLEARPDVACLQEVRSRAQIDRITAALAAGGWPLEPAWLAVDPLAPDGIAVTWVHPAHRPRSRCVPSPAHRFRSLWTRLEHPDVLVVNVHAPPQGPRDRARFYTGLLAALQHTRLPVIAAGDWNLAPQGVGPPGWGWWGDEERDGEQRLHARLPHEAAAAATHITGHAIDRVRSDRWRILRLQVLGGRRLVPMDHAPIVADLAPVR